MPSLLPLFFLCWEIVNICQTESGGQWEWEEEEYLFLFRRHRRVMNRTLNFFLSIYIKWATYLFPNKNAHIFSSEKSNKIFVKGRFASKYKMYKLSCYYSPF